MQWGLRAWLLTLPMPPLRRSAMLRAYGAHIGRNVRVHPVRIVNERWRNLTIGDDCYIGADVMLDLADRLEIARGAVLAGRVTVETHQDAGETHGSPTAARLGTFHRPTRIGQYAFVGTGAIILAGCSVGDEAVVGAGAVVTHEVAAHVTVVGVPARGLSTTR